MLENYSQASDSEWCLRYKSLAVVKSDLWFYQLILFYYCILNNYRRLSTYRLSVLNGTGRQTIWLLLHSQLGGPKPKSIYCKDSTIAKHLWLILTAKNQVGRYITDYK